ncbi:hypothetical protein [Bacillus canaveralius]|uniref:hypothetical protein n=1 Tax=Bacillus canaveralius TaxID=1403243 RepID=UPI000F7B2EB5|nr:hypothetical protein [Bacillus canaveralius]RSK54424.1 hypothetical protein EJA13_05705 [Bacillus canaveralius]
MRMYQAARQGQFGGGAMGQTMMGGTMMDGTMMGATRPQQAIFQPGFAGTNANQVRQDIFGGMTGDGFTQQAVGMQGGMMAGGMQDGLYPIRRGMQGTPQQAGNVQSVLQPGFGTNPQQVRQDIARDLAYGNQQQQGAGQQMTSLQAGMLGAGQGSLS